jgi:hypothetical protein
MPDAFIPFDVPPFEVYRGLRRLRELMKDWKWEGIQQSIKKGRNNAGLYDFLDHHYGNRHEVMKWVGSIFPCAIFRPTKNQIHDPDLVLDPELRNVEEKLEPHLAVAGQTYLELLQRTPASPWDGTTYRMTRIEATNQLKISCALGGFFDALKTSEMLEFEILKEAAGQGGTLNSATFTSFHRRLGLRAFVERASEDAVVNGTGRSCAVGIETLLVFKGNKGAYYALLAERSADKVSLHTDLVDVVPSFMFQPVVDWYEEEYSVTHNIFREYLEEVFNIEDVKHPRGHPFHNYFYDNPNLVYLQDLLRSDKAELLLTGVAMNLLNLRPDICTLLLIKEPEWYQNHSVGRRVQGLNLDKAELVDEYKSIDEIHASGKKGNRIMRLPSDFILKENSVQPNDFAPPGAAALYLGLQAAKDRLEI